jgi:hypothetical protein
MRKTRKRSQPPFEAIPAEIRALIIGRTVLVPKPDRFFGRLWREMLPALGTQVSKTKANTFKLNPTFFERFLFNIHLGLLHRRKADRSEHEASDRIAQALCDTADDLLLERSSTENETVWPAGRPLSEAWEPLKPLVPALWPHEEIYEYVQGQGLKPLTRDRTQHPRIGVTLHLARDPDTENLPELKISVKGRPIFDLIRPTQIPVDSPEWHLSVKEAKLLWNSLLHVLLVRLGIERPKRGRPGGNLGYRAAWLKHQVGMTWGQISHRLNQPKENCRKQAKQFWKRERDKYTAMAKPHTH